MRINWYDDAVRLTGRWSRQEKAENDKSRYVQTPSAYTTATAPGSYFEAAFKGRTAVLRFDLGYSMQPFPHMWVSVDNGPKIEVPVDRHLRIEAADDGNHVVKVIYKGGMEMLPRWYAPRGGAISFIGLDADAPGELPKDERRIIEFIGDSITEGVLTDADYTETPENLIDQLNRCYQDDNCATYAALTAENLNLRPIFQAYGATGMTRAGCGGVPRCGLTYPYVFDGARYLGEKPDVIVINHGANDSAAPAEEYLMRYGEFLDLVRETNPQAIVVCLSAFCGVFNDDLAAFVPEYNKKNGADVKFISSKGWVPREPLHPLRDGHRIIAEHLTAALKEML